MAVTVSSIHDPRYAVLFMLFCLTGFVNAEPVYFEDRTFADLDWEITSESLSPESSHTYMQKLTGGNPDAYREMTHTNPVNTVSPGDPTFVNITHRRIGWVYDPATQGAIDHIDLTMDRVKISGTVGGLPAPGAVGQVFRIFQGAKAYRLLSSTSLTSTVWETDANIELRAEDFGPEGARPDFSAAGAPIMFGYSRSNTNTGQGAEVVTVHGIDNFLVAVVPVGDQHDHDQGGNGGPLSCNPPPRITRNTDGSNTTASISGGVTSDNGDTFPTDFNVSETIRICVTIEPEAGEIGVNADIFVVVRIGTSFVQVTPLGLVPFNVTVQGLIAYAQIILQSSNNIDFLAPWGGQFTLTADEIGNYDFFVAYTTGNGVVTYNDEPFALNVIP